MNDSIQERIRLYIDFLSDILATNNDFEIWILNCIECLEFVLNNEEILEKPGLFQDLLLTLQLLDSWIIKNSEWAYIELERKFRKIYDSKEVGKSLSEILARLKNQMEDSKESSLIKLKDKDGNFKSTQQILEELSNYWQEYVKY